MKIHGEDSYGEDGGAEYGEDPYGEDGDDEAVILTALQ